MIDSVGEEVSRRAASSTLTVRLTRKCAVCRTVFTRRNMREKVCSPECAVELVERDRAKAARAAEREDNAKTRKAKEALKPRSALARKAQTAFNAFIRMRDAHLPCVSCGRMHEGQWHAGHYMSTGARPELRFIERNCHKQCQPCNTHLHGNLVLYRAELIRRCGLDVVEWLEGPHSPSKPTADELRGLRDYYRAKVRGK